MEYLYFVYFIFPDNFLLSSLPAAHKHLHPVVRKHVVTCICTLAWQRRGAGATAAQVPRREAQHINKQRPEHGAKPAP